MVTKLFLVRHGQTGIAEIDQKPDDPLSESGQAQVKRTAHRLQAMSHFAVIYSSTMERARQSAQIIAKITSYDKISQDARLNEIGAWSSPTQLHNPQESPERYEEALILLRKAETQAVAFLEEIAQKHRGKEMIIVCHGNIIRAMISRAIKASVETTVRLAVDNGSISLLEYDDQAQEPFFRLRLFNDAGHLD